MKKKSIKKYIGIAAIFFILLVGLKNYLFLGCIYMNFPSGVKLIYHFVDTDKKYYMVTKYGIIKDFPVRYALGLKRMEIIEYLISKNPEMINWRDPEIGYNIMQLCVIDQDLELLKLLIKYGGDIMTVDDNSEDKENWPNLLDFCISSYNRSKLTDVFKMIDFLEKNGVKKDKISSGFITRARDKKGFKFAKYLYEKYQIKWSIPDYMYRHVYEFFQKSLELNEKFALKDCLENGFDINYVEYQWDSIAHIAVREYQVGFLNQIIDKVDLGYKNYENETILELAKRIEVKGCVEVIEKEMERRSKMGLKH